MKSEHLLDAIGQIDDDLVLDAQRPVRRVLPFPRMAGLAAALALCVGLGAVTLKGLLPASGGSAQAPAAPAAPVTPMAPSAPAAPVAPPDGLVSYDQPPAPEIISVTTQTGTYFLTTDESEAAPEGSRALGELSAQPGQFPCTDKAELAGCAVWESPDGSAVYLQLPDGTWRVGLILASASVLPY